MLTYTKRESIFTETTEEITITAHKEWGCYTNRGNGILHRAAKTVLNKIQTIIDSEDSPIVKLTKEVNVLGTFMQKYANLCDSDDCDGASDTAVREVVWDFLEKVCSAIDAKDMADVIWERGRA